MNCQLSTETISKKIADDSDEEWLPTSISSSSCSNDLEQITLASSDVLDRQTINASRLLELKNHET